MILVIGYGNTLRGDDGIGPYLACKLAERIHRGDVEFLSCQRLVPELAIPISEADLVIFIDAREGGTPGCFESQVVEPRPVEGELTHLATPAALLASAQQLYSASPRGILLRIESETFAYSEGFSTALSAALRGMISGIQVWIELLAMRDGKETNDAQIWSR
jgi:hydrogenase maturation protease